MDIISHHVKMPELEDGQPCSPGCLSHITHPCEKCGRVAGSKNVTAEIIALRAENERLKTQNAAAEKQISGKHQENEFLLNENNRIIQENERPKTAQVTSESREKYWQKKAGSLASIANFMYQHVDESKLNSNQVDQCHQMLEEITEMLDFDEDYTG
jgi:hypothetical protein